MFTLPYEQIGATLISNNIYKTKIKLTFIREATKRHVEKQQ